MADRKRSFIFSIVLLVAGMTIGFLLLGIAYTGPAWVKLIVLVLYLFITAMVIRFSRRYIRQLSDRKG